MPCEVRRAAAGPPERQRGEGRRAGPFSGTDAAIKHVCRAFKDGTIGYLIDCPADLESSNLKLAFAVANANPELWDPATGAILRPGKVESRGSRTVVTWRADPEAAVFVMLRPSRSTAKKAKLYDDSKIQEISVGGSWDPAPSGADGTFTLKNALVLKATGTFGPVKFSAAAN